MVPSNQTDAAVIAWITIVSDIAVIPIVSEVSTPIWGRTVVHKPILVDYFTKVATEHVNEYTLGL